jgi:hypothetical protein
MSPSVDYELPWSGAARLESLVDRIEANPGRFVDPAELDAGDYTLRPALLRAEARGEGEDLLGALRLALLTESATDVYAYAIVERAERFEAPWLGRFTERVWRPDELLHHTPYRRMLLASGFGAAELDREIAEAQARQLDYHAGDTPVHVTAFGMLQEYLTDHWHGLLRRAVRRDAPQAAEMIGRVKGRETLHTMWYRDMTAIQLEARPEYVYHVAETLLHFQMPGTSIVPELEAKVPRWLGVLHADRPRMVSDLARLLYEVLDDPGRAGRLLLRVADGREARLGAMRASHLDAAVRRLGGRGYGLIGEALLENLGLGSLYRDGGSGPSRSTIPGVIRGLLRRWLARRIRVELGIEG